MPREIPREPYSSGYSIAKGIEVEVWNDDIAAVPRDLYRRLAATLGEPVVTYTGGLHYRPKPLDKGVPADTLAVPKHNHQVVEPDIMLVME